MRSTAMLLDAEPVARRATPRAAAPEGRTFYRVVGGLVALGAVLAVLSVAGLALFVRTFITVG